MVYVGTQAPRTPALPPPVNILCSGMAHLHSRGYLHRDMKPGNILVTENFEAKVADFGIAISGAARKVPNDQFEGTLFYMSPEVRAL